MKQVRYKLSGLAHVEVGDRIGEAALKPDDGLEKGWLDGKQCDKSCPYIPRAKYARIPLDRVVIEHQRCVAERFRAARQDEIHRTFANVSVSGVDRLHARPAIDLHGERRHCLTHAKTKRSDTRRIHFVSNDVDTAKNDLVEGVGREWLTQQQRTAALHGKINRRERSWFAARLDERCATAVNDINRTPCYSAAGLWAFACDGTPPFLAAPRDANSCGEKSSTAMAADTASAAACSCAASSALMVPASSA